MATGKAHINNGMLKWARLEAGLSLSGAAEAAGTSDARGISGEERIEAWENGEDFPTKNQCEALAKAYVQPLLVFYLPSPPIEPDPLPDFRKLSPNEKRLSPQLKAFIAKMKARQQEVIDILSDDTEDEIDPLPFIGRLSIEAPVDVFADDLRTALGISESDQRKLRDSDALFRLLRNKAEDLGIYVIVQGDLGSYHSSIDPKEFRGFCLADPIAPFVVLNNNDAKPALSFTLLHELAHLWLNESGISNLNPFDDGGDETKIETYCNRVASHFLMPPDTLLAAWDRAKGTGDLQAIADVAKEFSVSRRAVAYRLRMADELTFAQWRHIDGIYDSEWKARKEKQKEKQRQSKTKPNHFTTKRYQLGRRLVNTVLGALDAGALGYSSASRILGVASKGFKKIRYKVA